MVAALTVPVPALAGAVPTCHGQATTQVGDPGLPLHGTPGNDVLVTNGATGADLVDTTAVRGETAGHRPWVVLGAGADRFIGGALADFVNAGSGSSDTDADVIRTGAGPDHVDTGDSGPLDDVTNADTVQLGRGDDVLHLYGLAETASIDGGVGQNRLTVATCCSDRPVLVDNRSGHVYASAAANPGALVASYTGFSTFAFVPRYPEVRFEGSDRPEKIVFANEVNSEEPADYHATLTMRGGDDEVHAPGRHQILGTVRGGPGHDFVELGSFAHSGVRAAVATGVTSDGVVTTHLESIQDLVLYVVNDVRATLRGTDERNQIGLLGHSSAAVLHGGRGADRVFCSLTTLTGGPQGCQLSGGFGDDNLTGTDGADTVRGGPGRDRIRGRMGADTLRGGTGHDVVYGGPGVDHCAAEVEHSCEHVAR